MDGNKLKSAFNKVKSDIGGLSQDIATLQMQVASITRDSNSQVPETIVLDGSDENLAKKSDVESLVNNLEKELKNVKNSIRDLNFQFLENVKVTNAHTREISKCNDTVSGLDLKVVSSDSKSKSSLSDIAMLNDKFGDFQELINEKLTLEMNQIRLEFMEEIARVFDIVSKGVNNDDNKVKKDNSKKVSDDVSDDDLFEEKALDDKELDEISESRTLNYDESNEDPSDKKPGKFKRAVKWLFVDEEEDIDNIKDEVKSNSK